MNKHNIRQCQFCKAQEGVIKKVTENSFRINCKVCGNTWLATGAKAATAYVVDEGFNKDA